MRNKIQSWKTINRTALLSFGKWLTVESHTVELPDGQVIQDWPWLITPDYVNVCAFTADGKLLCFRQVKYAVEGESLALVGGYIEPGEPPLEAAKRELLEETGYEAEDWMDLGNFAVDANRGAGRAYFFLARQVHKTTERCADDLEEQELLILSEGEVTTALVEGQFKALPWTAAVALALQVERRR
jgi:ADP-ribose pyrophosphatase